MVTTLERRRMHKGLNQSKCWSHIFNILLLLVALGAIGAGVWSFLAVWAHPAREGTLNIVGHFYLACTIIPAALGVVVILVVLIGSCGLCATHRCTLLWFFSLLMVTFVLTIAGTVFNFIFYFELQDTIADSLSTSVKDEYGLYGFEEVTRSIDSIQTQFECCGSLSYEEWKTSEWHRYEGLQHFRDSDVPTIPRSCCTMKPGDGNETEPVNLTMCSSMDSTYPNDFMFSQSCSDLVYMWLSLHALILAVACAALFVTDLMAVAACAVLFRRLGPIHYEEQRILHRLKGDPDWQKRKKRHAMSRV